MQIEQSVIDSIVARPAESLNVELKRWIDPKSNAGIEKIAKAILALRNRNGGYLVIGFDDNTLLPDTGNEPANVRAEFHVDDVQAIVSRYSSELFEIGVGFGQKDGVDHPIIVVPPGVRTPVAAKRDLVDGGKVLIRHSAIYFRTLAANGTPSTAEARPEDWRDIVEICFDNREADFGRFLRRQLGSTDVATLLNSFQQLGANQSAPPPSLRERAEFLQQDGYRRFQTATQERTFNPEELKLFDLGSWDVAMVVDPPHAQAIADQQFLATIRSANPNYTGWPVWFDSSTLVDQTARPRFKEKGIEALIVSVAAWSNHLDFMRFDPRGEFYLHRLMQDDATQKVAPQTALDPIITILRVAEAIAVGIALSKALGWSPQETRLGFAFHWRRLKDRVLSRWADPYGGFEGGKVYDDEIATFVEFSLDTPLSAIAPVVEQATQDLFAAFNGYSVSSAVVEDWVKRLIERRLV